MDTRIKTTPPAFTLGVVVPLQMPTLVPVPASKGAGRFLGRSLGTPGSQLQGGTQTRGLWVMAPPEALEGNLCF